MDTTLAWGLEVVREFQKAASPPLTLVMQVLSFMGTKWFYLVALCAVYWCLDRRNGVRIGATLLVSAFMNGWLKLVTAEPRPYDFDQSVGMAREPTFGFPSAHAQNSAVFWGTATKLSKVWWLRVAAIGLPFLIGLSRIYLGVHFPTDVLAGWAIGLCFVFGERFAGPWIERALGKLPDQLQLAALAALALAMNSINRAEAESTGVFFGFCAGLVYVLRKARFDTGGGVATRLGRLALGVVVALGLYFALGAVLKEAAFVSKPLGGFIRGSLVGVWLSYGAPVAFLALGLARREETSQPALP
jgi:membrane-associated phospholipid phosphatase